MRQSSMLVREIKVMNEMKHYSGFPRLITYGKSEEYNYIVMTLLGRNLDSLMKKCGHRFSLATIANVGYQMVRLLEKLHYKNLVPFTNRNYSFNYNSRLEDIYIYR